LPPTVFQKIMATIGSLETIDLNLIFGMLAAEKLSTDFKDSSTEHVAMIAITTFFMALNSALLIGHSAQKANLTVMMKDVVAIGAMLPFACIYLQYYDPTDFSSDMAKYANACPLFLGLFAHSLFQPIKPNLDSVFGHLFAFSGDFGIALGLATVFSGIPTEAQGYILAASTAAMLPATVKGVYNACRMWAKSHNHHLAIQGGAPNFEDRENQQEDGSKRELINKTSTYGLEKPHNTAEKNRHARCSIL